MERERPRRGGGKGGRGTSHGGGSDLSANMGDRKGWCTDPFVEDLSPLFRQSPVKHDSPRLLGGLVYREVLTNHGADDVGEQRGLQPSYGGFRPLLLLLLLLLLLSYQSGYTENDDDPRLILGFLSTSSHSAAP